MKCIAPGRAELPFAKRRGSATGLTAGFYTLAGQGALKMLASESFERPGFQGQAVLVSNHAWEGGLKAFTDWPGH